MAWDDDDLIPENDGQIELHRDRCEMLRDLIQDLTMVWGEACKELLQAVDAYEREPLLLAELALLRKTEEDL